MNLHAWEKDIERMRNWTITKIAPRETASWYFDEYKEKAYIWINVDFEFKEEPGKTHTMDIIKYEDEEEFTIGYIQIFHDGGWIPKEFCFSKHEIEQNEILKSFSEQMKIKSRLHIITKIKIAQVPIFCPICRTPLGGCQGKTCSMQ